MKKKIKSKAIKKTIPLTKSLGELMKDEDGFVSKETILKVGLSTVAALGVVGSMVETSSGQSAVSCTTVGPNTPPNWCTHTNTVSPPAGMCAQHTNITTHTSY